MVIFKKDGTGPKIEDTKMVIGQEPLDGVTVEKAPIDNEREEATFLPDFFS